MDELLRRRTARVVLLKQRNPALRVYASWPAMDPTLMTWPRPRAFMPLVKTAVATMSDVTFVPIMRTMSDVTFWSAEFLPARGIRPVGRPGRSGAEISTARAQEHARVARPTKCAHLEGTYAGVLPSASPALLTRMSTSLKPAGKSSTMDSTLAMSIMSSTRQCTSRPG